MGGFVDRNYIYVPLTKMLFWLLQNQHVFLNNFFLYFSVIFIYKCKIIKSLSTNLCFLCIWSIALVKLTCIFCVFKANTFYTGAPMWTWTLQMPSSTEKEECKLLKGKLALEGYSFRGHGFQLSQQKKLLKCSS